MEALKQEPADVNTHEDPLLVNVIEPLPETRDEDKPFCRREELLTLWSLVWPLLISFWGRMAMASTDASFVGHLRNKEPVP